MTQSFRNMLLFSGPCCAEDRSRTEFAEWFACAVSGDKHDGHPYMPNQNQTNYWTLDRGNDWKIGFDDKDPWVLLVRHRYHNQEAVDALTRWAAYRLGATAIHETERTK
jgi:hypothetical protein